MLVDGAVVLGDRGESRREGGRWVYILSEGLGSCMHYRTDVDDCMVATYAGALSCREAGREHFVNVAFGTQVPLARAIAAERFVPYTTRAPSSKPTRCWSEAQHS